MDSTEWLAHLDAHGGSVEVFGSSPAVMPLVERGLVALSGFHGPDRMWRTATLTKDGRASLQRRREAASTRRRARR